ncbi:DegQ family serine endoprotease [Emcibacter nanhaiensis]|uniref:DegQ family serine endoprotease n=1 Tax=Emcibacter nanhaiensis TaxID=1505037 RepID=A0A501PL03_9PROT|nr:DegQ family serine endoprotease [Emcibacter nanhaiensis]TPD60604.1 DegQ family serine endoprotease [Emcibacter nanhaiensis]
MKRSCVTLLGAILMGLMITGATHGADRKVPQSQAEVTLSYSPIVKKAAPAVVNIYTKRVIKTRSRSPFFDDPFFQRFFGQGLGGMPRERIERSLGSGVIVRENGTIVTNHHVIDGADEIVVALSDRREFSAEVILDDAQTDLAVLKIDGVKGRLPVLEFADSDEVEVGDLVLAIGNPFGVGQTVTSGIVSALARTQLQLSNYQSYIQTDAAVNPGNSGGALIGMDGRLLGINSAIFSRSGGSNGIGFAIPANMVHFVVTSALSGGKVVRPWFGANGQAVTSEIAESLGLDRPGGVLVDNIYPDGPADKAGIEQGDVILSVDGKEVFDPQAIRYHIGLERVGGEVPVEILRGDDRRTVMMPLAPAVEDPPRDITVLEGNHIFTGLKVANLSPAYADELGLSMFDKGVIVLSVDRVSPVRRLGVVRPGDFVESVNGNKVETVDQLQDLLNDVDRDMSFGIRRQGRLIECGVRGNSSYYCR